MRMRVLLVIALALTAGGSLAFATYKYVEKTPSKMVSMPTHPVVVSAADLDIGAELTTEDVRVIDWPASSVPKDAISDPKEVVGRGLILPVIQNEPILPMKLASKDAGAGLPPAIPPGLRAVSVRVNEVIGVSGYVVPGTHVDVLGTLSPTEKTTDMTTKVILTDVQVLAAGTKIERDTDKNKPVPVNVVTLLVNPDESERLTLAANEGKIQLALRNPLDRAQTSTKGVKPAALLGMVPPVRQVPTRNYPAPVVTKPVDPPTVEIIRGDKRAREVVHEEQ
jgi:pilus assembly protein CpaB